MVSRLDFLKATVWLDRFQKSAWIEIILGQRKTEQKVGIKLQVGILLPITSDFKCP